MGYAMKNLILLFLVSSLMMWGCSNNNKDNPVSPQNLGKIKLNIDRANAPANVTTVEAILTRDGFDTITESLNLLSDSTADILLDGIAAGTWHLVVNAMDTSNVVLYSGETDVEILAGFTTQINLVLNPTGQGVGSIYLYVTWGTVSSLNWVDYINNPILLPTNNGYDNYGIAQPVVLQIDNQYKMWYMTDAGSGQKYVFYAKSNDGISWNRPFNEPVLFPGSPNTWDSWAVHPGAIIKDGDQYRMYYTGFADPYGQWGIGLATSTDGINWEKYPNPLLYGTSGWEFQIGASSVIKHNGTYFLFYAGRNLPVYKIGLATSTDGINFTRYSGNPILTNTEDWEEDGVAYPSVILENDQFKMNYMNSTGTAFGFAYSPDGMNWTKDTNNPFFTKDNTANGWAAVKIAYPNFIKLQNEHRIYYSGYNSNNSLFKIGFMRKLRN